MISSAMNRNDEKITKRHLTDIGKFWTFYLLFILSFTVLLLL